MSDSPRRPPTYLRTDSEGVQRCGAQRLKTPHIPCEATVTLPSDREDEIIVRCRSCKTAYRFRAEGGGRIVHVS